MPGARWRSPAALRLGDPHTVDSLLDLQRTAGNVAVTNLLRTAQRQAQPPAAPSPDAGPAPASPQLSTRERLAEPRVDWINALPTPLRNTIDSLGEKTSTQVAHLERALAAAKASATGAAKIGRAKKASSLEDIEDAIAALDAKVGDTRYKNRHALMDYMACSLGGDAGTRAYFESLVDVGNSLVLHPEVARRLDRVRRDLDAKSLPMPETTVGQSLRGDHTRNTRERTSPGMLTHAMGVAVDFYAYKNVHVKDHRLMAVLGAVGKRSHSMSVSNTDMTTIKAMGEVSMGKAASDPAFEAKAQAIIDKVGEEFDKLTEASDRVQNSLPVGKAEVLELHNQVRAAMSELASAKQQARRASKKDKAAAAAALQVAQLAYAVKMAALRPRLETMFAPWKKSLAAEIAKINADARANNLSMDDITSDPALAAQAKAVRGLRGKPRAAIESVAADAKRLTTSSARVGGEVGSALAWLDSDAASRIRAKASPDQVAAWKLSMTDLIARAGGVQAAAVGPHATASMLLGKPDASLPATRKGLRRFNGDGDLKQWVKQLDALEPKATDLTGKAADLHSVVPAEHREAAARHAAMVAGNAKSLATLKTSGLDDKAAAAALSGWKEKKKDLFWLQKAADDLIDDPTFMFKELSVADPGVAQLTQAIGAEKGAGGFFGMTDKGKADPASHQAGFNRQFFQTMVRYGFEPAARWKTADTMHFEVDRLVGMIVPGTDCDPPTTPKAIEAERTALARAQAYVASAAESREAWDAEAPERRQAAAARAAALKAAAKAKK